MGYLNTLLRLIGHGCIIFGLIFTALGLFGLAGSPYAPTFHIGGEVVSPQEGGQRTSIVGIILLLVGIVITIIHHQKMK